MRVHFFVRTLNEAKGGGSHYNAIQYVRFLRKRGHEVAAHVFYDSGNAFPEDITPVVHRGFGRSVIGERDYLAELLKKYEPDADVFFLYGVDFMWGGGRYRRRGGAIPAVVYIDAYLPSMGRVHLASLKERIYRYKRLVWDKFFGLRDARYIDRFLPCSPYIGSVYAAFGLPKDRFTVLPNIIPNTAEGMFRAPKEKNGKVRVLYVGRLTHDKGIDLLLAALARIPRELWRLTVVGDGEMRPVVERAIANGLDVKLKGWVPQKDVGHFYAAADVFAHPARWADPAPRTVVDALSFGLPAVVPDAGGSAWLAAGAGLAFRTGDLNELHAQLEKLIRDAALRAVVGARGPARAADFREEKSGAILERILAETCAKKHSGDFFPRNGVL